MRTVTTRTQRRMERKQALLLLLMVLAVALVSFTLGVMVGRSGSVGITASKGADSREETVRKHPAPTPPTVDEEAAREANSGLTFYDTLPKGGKSPLGSGINLPPEDKGPAAAVDPTPQKPLEEPAPKVQTEKTPADDMPAPKPEQATTGETFFLQVASFRTIKGALELNEKLREKGYPAEVREVDLGEKGVWSRVVVGPYKSRQEAQAALERLKSEERLSPMLRKG